MLGNEALGAELFQDAWSKIIKARERYQVRAKFKTYLFHVAHNLIIDQWRKNNPEFLSVELHAEYGNELESEIILEEQLENQEKLNQFRNAVLELPPQQRDVLLLHYDHGLTLEQIADLDGIGRETVKSRLRYAMQKLKKILSTSELHSGYSQEEVSND
jgi:RNA polymerase sigma-70 factor (ECF subfamily)